MTELPAEFAQVERPRPLPGRGSLGAWAMAARPKTLVASIAPVVLGTFVGAHGFAYGLDVAAALMALAVGVLVQIGTNLVNDAADHARGADTLDRLGPPRAVSSGLLGGRTVMIAGLLCLVAAGAVGLALIATTGTWWLLIPGGIALVCGVIYTAGPWPLAYLGLGEVFVFLFFGLFATIGSYLVQRPNAEGLFNAAGMMSFATGVAMGLLGVAMIEVNNIRDIPTDAEAGKRTLAVRIGDRAARRLYLSCILGSYAALLLMGPLGLFLMIGPIVFTVPALVLILQARHDSGRELNALLGYTAMFQGLYVVGILAETWLIFLTSPRPT